MHNTSSGWRRRDVSGLALALMLAALAVAALASRSTARRTFEVVKVAGQREPLDSEICAALA